MSYETIVGIEVHTELSTKSKIFCKCTTEFGGDVNTHCCPICVGMPGTLPVLNKKVVEYAIKAGLALNCKISKQSKLDRKNYFYPDLPKAYQISQYDMPLCENGFVEIESEGSKKKIRITRVHIEEDAGKLLHEGFKDYSLVDYNRCGVPLIEIVTEPDINSPEEAGVFLDKLKAILQYLNVSDCKMEEGSLRCDVNINVREIDGANKTKITEMKNMNSFKAAIRAMQYEELRHRKLLKEGKQSIKETRRWDDAKGESYPMRSKEEAHDYRYFPEPDLVSIEIKKEWLEKWKNELPELPYIRKERFVEQYNLPEYDAEVLTVSKALADFFEAANEEYKNPKNISNWIMGEVLRLQKEKQIETEDILIKPSQLVGLLRLIDDGTISSSIGKKVFEEMFNTGKDADVIVKEKGLIQISDEDQLLDIVINILKDNPKSVDDYKAGKTQAVGFLVGQVMRATKGKANPGLVTTILQNQLK